MPHPLQKEKSSLGLAAVFSRNQAQSPAWEESCCGSCVVMCEVSIAVPSVFFHHVTLGCCWLLSFWIFIFVLFGMHTPFWLWTVCCTLRPNIFPFNIVAHSLISSCLSVAALKRITSSLVTPTFSLFNLSICWKMGRDIAYLQFYSLKPQRTI